MSVPDAEEISAELKGARIILKEAEKALAAGLDRLAVSGSYYAIYHAARAALWSIGFNPKTHRNLVSEFNRKFVKTEKVEIEFAKILKRGKEKRERVDYDMIALEQELENSEQIVRDAGKFVEGVDKLFN